MIIEFEVSENDKELICFFKRKRWPDSKIIRPSQAGAVFFAKNMLVYDNYQQLTDQAIILSDRTYIFRSDNPKNFDKAVREAKKNKVCLSGGSTPSSELISIVKEAYCLGKFVLRLIHDDTALASMAKYSMPIGQFDKYFLLQDSMEIRFTD